MEHGAVEVLRLLLVGSAVGMVARRFRVPYSLALVVAGIALSFIDLHQLEAFRLSAGVLFTFWLPALLFEAALHLDLHDLMDAKIGALFALPGVLISTGLAAAMLYGGLASTQPPAAHSPRLRRGLGLTVLAGPHHRAAARQARPVAAAVAGLAQLDERLSSLREANAGHAPRLAVLEQVLGSNPTEQAVDDAVR